MKSENDDLYTHRCRSFSREFPSDENTPVTRTDVGNNHGKPRFQTLFPEHLYRIKEYRIRCIHILKNQLEPFTPHHRTNLRHCDVCLDIASNTHLLIRRSQIQQIRFFSTRVQFYGKCFIVIFQSSIEIVFRKRRESSVCFPVSKDTSQVLSGFHPVATAANA